MAEKNPFLEDAEPTKVSEGGLTGALKAAGRGLYESVPFVGEKKAEEAGLPQPSSFAERLTRRAARNLPYALAASPFVTPAGAALGLMGSTALGQAAEEIGVPESYQPVAEIIGGGIGPGVRGVAGRTLGYTQPALVESSKKAAKAGYELGPSSRAERGMMYGAGPTEESAIRNLDKFTKDAAQRAGNPLQAGKGIDGSWIKDTSTKLSNEASRIFSGKSFATTPQFSNDIVNIEREAAGIFGEQGNAVSNLLEKNIQGYRPGGAFTQPKFKAEDLRSAIVDVNERLMGEAPANQKKVLYKLKDSLEKLVEDNFKSLNQPQLVKDYNDWKSNYHSFATIKDLVQRGTGITGAKQIDPAKLKSLVESRTGGNPVINPLYDNLAEFGNILAAKTTAAPGLLKAGYRTITESPLVRALGGVFQPSVAKRGGSTAAAAQTVAPATQYTQQKSEQ